MSTFGPVPFGGPNFDPHKMFDGISACECFWQSGSCVLARLGPRRQKAEALIIANEKRAKKSGQTRPCSSITQGRKSASS